MNNNPSKRLSRAAAGWIRLRWPLLAMAAVIAAVAVGPASRLQFDRSIVNMFAPDDPLTPPFLQLSRTFGASELVLACYVEDDLLSAQGMSRLAALEARLRKAPGVKATLSLRSPVGDGIIDDTPTAARLRDVFAGYTHSEDLKTACIVCILTPEHEAAAPRAETIAALRAAVAELPSGVIVGEPVMIVDGFAFIEQDGRRLGLWSTILLTIVIAACFRSLRWVLIPMLVVQWALLTTRATLVWANLDLSMVSTMLTAIVTVVGVATVIHVIVRYRDARLGGESTRDALAGSSVVLAAPVLWSCATDAVGFGALLVTSVGPVRDFGLMMAIGALLVLPAVALLLPGLTLGGTWDADPHTAPGDAWLGRGLRQALHVVRRRSKSLLAVVLAASAVVAVGSRKLEVESDFTRNFRQSSQIVRSYAFVEERLGGAGVWDVVLPAPKQLDWPYLAKVLRLEEHLRRDIPRDELTKVISLADAVDAASAIDLEKLPLESLQNTAVRAGVAGMRIRMPEFVDALYHEDPDQPGRHYFRVMLRAKEQQSSRDKMALINRVRAICQEDFPDGQVTGYYVLLTHLIESMLRDQWSAFGVAIVGIGLMMILALRDLRLAGVAVVPNILPVLLVMGLMGWLGLKINMGAAMIAAVSIGLSVDSSIHYLTEFRRQRRAGLETAAALDVVQQSVGRAVVFSTLALIVGFSTLCLSQFVPTVYFGVLVSLTMLGGLFGNLIVLPLLLVLVDGREGADR